MKTKEQIKVYNKEYFSRPEVIIRSKVRNLQRKDKRKLYKKTEKGKTAENRYRRKNYEKSGFDKRLISRYGITREQYDKMILFQNGVCAISMVQKEEKLYVDHDHFTGNVRGLLCGSCNRALGLLKDSPEFLLKAIQYLRK